MSAELNDGEDQTDEEEQVEQRVKLEQVFQRSHQVGNVLPVTLGHAPELSEFRVFGIAVNSYATSRIGRLSNHNIEKLKTCILYIICID